MIKVQQGKYIKMIVTYRTNVSIKSPELKDVNSISEEMLKATEQRLLYHAGYVSTMDAPKKYLFDDLFLIKLCSVFKLNYYDEASDAYDVEDVHFEIRDNKVFFVVDWKGRVNKSEENFNYEIELFGKEGAEKEILRMATVHQQQSEDWQRASKLEKKETSKDVNRKIEVETTALELEY